jgi:hypothetical protein
MTGLVFISMSKYIEIGKIIVPVKDQQLMNSTMTNSQ